MIHKLTLNIRFFVLVISLATFPVATFGHGGGLNALGCHNNKKTGGYHCHQGGNSSSSLGSLKPSMNEDFYNMALARKLDGETEVTFEYEYGLKGNTPLTASIRIDIVTDEYVIEGGKDKRSSLDSIQQAVFASTLADKKPAVAIYDTDGRWGKYEHRVWAAAKELGLMFLPVWFGPTNQENTPVMYPMYSSKPLPDGEFCFPLPADGKECVETQIN